MRALLEWDATWAESLGWFSTSPFRWTPRSLAQIADDEHFDLPAFSTCFLLPGGADSRRALVVTPSTDALGEIPVVLVATDDVPFLCVYMAGLDAFLGHVSGVQPIAGDTYEDVARDMRFRARMSHHGLKLMKGSISTDFPSDTLRPRPARRGTNPFTGETLEIAEVPAGEIPIDW